MNISNSIHEYIALTKPRVVMLMILTTIIGMILAINYENAPVDLIKASLSIISIFFLASAAAIFNQLADQKIDAIMLRTNKRPLPQGTISTYNAFIFGLTLTIIGVSILYFYVNSITAILTFLTLIGYAVVYTLFLKKLTPQNIVIGGIAGATPPLLGWTAITNSIAAEPLLLVLIIFVWTPPHFWALAIYRHKDYKNAKVPMLPITHGIEYTKLNILLYTVLMCAVTYLPYCIYMGGVFYAISVSILNIIFLYYSIALYVIKDYTKYIEYAVKTFRYSIIYLMLLFICLLIDNFMMY